jgi:two-component system chemotaxis response regulator CheB
VIQSVESLLYQSMRGLEETTLLLDHLGSHFKAEKKAGVASLFFEKAAETGHRARVVHESILQHEALSGDLQCYPRKRP